MIIQTKVLPDGFFVAVHEVISIWWGGFGSHGFANQLDKMPVHEWNVLFFRMT